MTDYNEPDELSGEDVADFDAFLGETDEERTGQPFRMYGRTYRLPETLPLLFTLEVERLRHSDRAEDIRTMLTVLFGPDAIRYWASKCMPNRTLRIVLAWAARNVAEPGSMSMEEAVALYEAEKAEEAAKKAPAGKAPTPRPAKAKTKSTPKKRAVTKASSGGR